MTTQLLQQALDALEIDSPLTEIAKEALRSALAAPQAKPVAWMTDDGKVFADEELDGCTTAGLTPLYATPPAPQASPVPDGMVMVPREPTEEMIQAAAGAWGESESGLHNAFAAALRGGIAAAPAAPVVREPLTDSELAKIAVEDEFLLYCDQDSFNEIARAIELAHGITGASK